MCVNIWNRVSSVMTLYLLSICLCSTLSAKKKAYKIPDLTKGEKLEIKTELPVGPVGIRCWVVNAWRHRVKKENIRQYLVKDVDKGSPADGIPDVDINGDVYNQSHD